MRISMGKCNSHRKKKKVEQGKKTQTLKKAGQIQEDVIWCWEGKQVNEIKNNMVD